VVDSTREGLQYRAILKTKRVRAVPYASLRDVPAVSTVSAGHVQGHDTGRAVPGYVASIVETCAHERIVVAQPGHRQGVR
jgi:hypothetical protein